MDNNYVEIDLLDLCKTVLKKWKIILACTLVCAILGGVYGALQANKAKPETEAQVAALTAGMTQEEIDNVKDAAEIINNYRSMYKVQKEYNEKSIYQNLNPYDVSTLTLSYYVDNHYKVSYPIISENNNLVPIVQTYISVFTEDSFYEGLAEFVDGVDNSTYIRELIKVNTEEKNSGVLIVTVYANTDEMLAKIGEFIKTTVADRQSEIAEVYGEHDIILASESTGKTVDTDMAEAQNKNVERLTTLATNISNEENLFSGNQLTFLKYLVHEELDEEISIVKYVVFGLFVGIVISFAVFCVMYLASGTVKTENELATILGATFLGKLDTDVEFASSKISNAASVNNCDSVAVIADKNDDLIEKMVGLVKPGAVLILDVLNERKAFEDLVKCAGAVFVESPKKTSRKQLRAKKRLCMSSDVKILGFITE